MSDNSNEAITREEENRQAIYRVWGDLVVRAWQDPAFAQKLTQDPRKFLAAEGVEFPAHIKISVAVETDSQFVLHLPTKPTGPVSHKFSGAVGNMARMSSFGVCDDMVKAILR